VLTVRSGWGSVVAHVFETVDSGGAGSPQPDGKQKANARLIVAAPKMLDALLGLAQIWEEFGHISDAFEFQHALDAIAEATGEEVAT
jgi:hypothetical protein